MAIAVTMTSATTPAELATLVNAGNVSGQVTTANSTSDSGVKNMAEKSAQNCDVFGAINGLLADAEAAVKTAYKATTEAVEKLFTDIMSAVGDLSKTLKSAASAAVAKIQQFCTWLSSQASNPTLVANAKAAIQAIFDSLNSVYTAISDAATAVANKIGEIATEMFESVKKVATLACEKVTGAISSIGTGAGIDSMASTVAAKANGMGSAMTTALSNVGAKLDTTASSMTSTQTSVSTSASTGITTLNANVAQLNTIMGV